MVVQPGHGVALGWRRWQRVHCSMCCSHISAEWPGQTGWQHAVVRRTSRGLPWRSLGNSLWWRLRWHWRHRRMLQPRLRVSQSVSHYFNASTLSVYVHEFSRVRRSNVKFNLYFNVFSARCNIYISHLCYDVSVPLSVRLSVCDGSSLGHYS